MKCNIPGCPIKTLDVVHEHCTFGFTDGDGQLERIPLSSTRECADDNEPARPVISFFGNHERRAALGLLTPCLRVEVDPNDVPGTGHILGFHSMTSFPTSGEARVSPCRFSGVILETSSLRVGTLSRRLNLIAPVSA